MSQNARRRGGAAEAKDAQFIAGILTQQVELSGERLEIGIVTHARYIRETLALLDGRATGAALAAAPEAVPTPGAVNAMAVAVP
jgi:hypothetical protein